MKKETMLGKILVMISGLPLERVLYDLCEKLSSDAGREWLAELKRFLRKEPCWMIGKIKKFLEFSDETFVIPACDGSKGLADGSCTVWTDLGLADERGFPADKIIVKTGRLIECGSFLQIFGSLLGVSTGEMKAEEFIEKYYVGLKNIFRMTPHQVKIFIDVNQDWIESEKTAVFIPYKSNEFFFVAYGYFDSVWFKVRVVRLENNDILHAEGRHRFVV